jgi:phenylacetate-CoA ligase
MEYGTVECGVVAHTHPDGGYRVFWRSHLIEAVGEGSIRRIVVTSLYPRAFPLVRFELGDEIEIADDAPAAAIGLAAFRRVVGRCNDYVVLADGFTVHSEVFSHAVRPCADVRSFQIVQQGDALSLRYTSAGDLPQAERSGIQQRLERVHPALERIRFERVEELSQTVAGKTRMVIRL